ncbi:phosphate acyltransferase PlsX [Paenibacillus radicis (ex Gao et al. 2016)]|uniref:Phosphate acyltransferase n=1 Tax=Paenibacillus radicis (ex Gao et al. 2016) TaxID=1737354 RepID=A0A917HKG8_9BACL|nr:phosphate acyltransferase PlsX [Paenibacillus radicis (ex Gao et al. 2016)]GGG81094.1 phosphate acyltransferase [Paenibacillus radicis (ex Gao et al. 2016)]
MRIAIDAMGGDHAPGLIVQGAVEAAREWPDTELLLVGDTAVIEPLLQGQKPANLQLHHTDEVIGADEEPVKAVRRKKGASMVVAGQLVREKQADAMLSAGNTGALMTTGLLVVGRLDGIERPALAPMLPTMDDIGVLALDLGANMDAKPEHLLQYAIMGSIYRSKVHGMEKPRVGLLNVGTEEKKGNELTKAAYDLLTDAPINFIGNVESRDILQRSCDVLICDGFAGNIMLKSMEGTAGSLLNYLKDAFGESMMTKLAAAIMLPRLRKLKKKMDYKEHGSAPLLGLNGLVMKCHGSSDALAVRSAVRQARTAIQGQLTESIAAEISGK